MQSVLKPKKPDLLLMIPVAVLLGFGMVMVYSASGIQSRELYNDSGVIFFKQFVAMIMGLAAFAVGFAVPHKVYRRKSVLLTGVAIVTLLLIAVKFQSAANGATRWFYIGRFGFQPSDLAKLLAIMVVAAFATAQFEGPKLWQRRLIPIFMIVGLFCSLILIQPDFGTTMIIIFIVGLMLFLAGIPKKYLMIGGLLLLPLIIGLVLTKGYRFKRITDFIYNEHYQNRQAKIAIGSGGLNGLGLGQGKQKLYYLPEPHTDFIYATLGEEFGFLGTLSVVLCFFAFLLRGIYVLNRVDSPHSQVLGAGLLLLITTQAFMNISITLALFPNKGITLPFMSAGGTSLILMLGICGILLNISRFRVVDNRVAV
ncbi:FtsW/RodA/SpoVE family cell cycle protein [Acanthopleuribacter pedis]|uniref:Probable peptidoglycan glycosyltransferase FtsW n=1 Tax=Acanthopleuribacter pedis TaxID=442870 RepID=A0A8J7Q8D4_9BACT|nr:FtsW/RodA/SpoVE family cell cycle protein [Acanthopleuribacter pedis]MBO1318754.1 FtsW/RodA/SpoVE family cell cycle protein [Acanthopleuribacter pedis]